MQIPGYAPHWELDSVSESLSVSVIEMSRVD